MSVTVYTYLPAAAKVTLDVDGSKVKIENDGSREGVPPGVMVKEGDEVVGYFAAQAFGVLVRDDKATVEAGAAPPAKEED